MGRWASNRLISSVACLFCHPSPSSSVSPYFSPDILLKWCIEHRASCLFQVCHRPAAEGESRGSGEAHESAKSCGRVAEMGSLACWLSVYWRRNNRKARYGLVMHA